MKLGAPQSLTNSKNIFQTLVKKNLESWDLNCDGKISSVEVDQFVPDADLKGLDAVTLATLKWAFQKFPEVDSSGVDASNLFPGKQHHGMDVSSRFATYESRLNESEELFVGHGPEPDSLKQGLRGSCALLAALHSRAGQKPEALTNSIETEDGGYRVKLFSHDEFVTKPTTVERLTGAQSNGVWATVLEKAFAQGNPKNLPPSSDVYDYLDRGLAPEDVIYELSGDSTTECVSLGAIPHLSKDAEIQENAMDYPVLLTVVHEELSRSVGEGTIAMASTCRDPRSGRPTRSSHAYSVTDYDSDTLEVTLRNPWGHTDLKGLEGLIEDDQDDGVFRATLDGLLKNFHTIEIGGEMSDRYLGKGAADGM